MRFESLVNLEGCKTIGSLITFLLQFESLVNLEGCKTKADPKKFRVLFESLVNLEGCKTEKMFYHATASLRVLLI